MDVSQYLEIFIDESNEHLQTLSDELMVLEKEPENKDTINEIFRAAHSLKGMAGTMGYKRMQNLTHNMENVFSEIRNDKMKVNSKLVDVLFQCLDALESYVDNIRNTQDEGTDDNEPIIKELNDFLANEGQENAQPKEEKPQEEAKPEGGTDETITDVSLADFEKNAVNEALKKGMHVCNIHVYVDPNCILKAARAFLVFKNLEGHGDVIKSMPSVQDIEDEKFDFDFSIVFVTEEEASKILDIIKNVSEIKDAVLTEIKEPLKTEDDNAPAEASKEEHKNEAPAQDSAEKKPAPSAAKKPAQAASAKPGVKPVGRSVRVDIEKLDVLMNLVSELIIAKNGLVASASDEEGNAANQGFHEQIEYLERVTTNLHESVMKVRMMPIESVVSKFPRMIRDLSKKLNKKMELYMTGEETELDRTVIDEIGDPLMHLLRNSADHGLESAEVRAERGKPEVGSIFLNAYQDGNNVVIEVGDDGNGIDVEKVKAKAIEKGNITEEQAEMMTEKEIIDLLFRPSFSTSDKITDVSGRGVGLDVVKSKIEALGGAVEVKTTYGVGSTFIIHLPLTLAIIQALMVKLGDEKYAISLDSIQTIEDIPVSEIKYVHAKEVINLRGNVIPLVRLRELLDVPGEPEESENITVVIVSKGDKQAGLVVDSLIGQLEIVIKSLGKYININKMISGATILGDGSVALIIDANTLV
ncbi:chemotaxis protein CheA [[Bacteroides] pectinophilus]|jgi:two-component system chemotaxis sensor kinase CheA|uniref:Chemotaxis protein CheA n=1 Tax=[Bacteroides] pectinophilus ATCC 43243 TaxID=483218 RepID=B7ATT5_9FIRM|nr:CheW-like protein [[Bacteroides] pectinophilus ATCC 43243]UWN94597.1 chemotaxis protein CheA [[Bacteroides] pectinophilus]